MIEIGSHERRIARPLAALWATLTEVPRWRDWMPGVRWAVLEGELDGGYVTIRPQRGRQTAYRVTSEAPRRVTLALTFGPLARIERELTLAPDGDGTLVRQSVRIGGPFGAQLAGALARRAAAGGPALLEALASA